MPVKRALRSSAARLARPLLAAIDERLEVLAARLEAHTANLAAEQRQRFDQLDETLSIDLRVVDEHLFAIERLSASASAAADVVSWLERLSSGADASLVMVVPDGVEASVPAGYEVIEHIEVGRGGAGALTSVALLRLAAVVSDGR